MRHVRIHAFDGAVLALYVAAEIAAVANPVDDGSRAAQLLLPAAWTLPLLARRRAPAVAALAVFAALALESQLAQPATESVTVLLPVMLAFWVAGTVDDRSVAVAVGVSGALLTGLVVSANPGPFGLGDAFFVAIFTLAPFVGGLVTHAREQRAAGLEQRTTELERDREGRARAAVADERARIARELHDVVGHAISVMTVQSGAARLNLELDPDRAREALLTVEDTGRQALAEMRRMLEVLRATGIPDELVPQPGLSDLQNLVTQSRESGLEVEVDVIGQPRPVSPGIDLAAYRIVQEALTNVRKHGAEPRARVTLEYESNALEVSIDNDGPPGNGNRPPEGGHGHVGMRERVTLYSGQLTVGPRPEGGYRVLARLPLDARPA